MSRVSGSYSFKIDRDQIAIAAAFVLIVGIVAELVGLSAHALNSVRDWHVPARRPRISASRISRGVPSGKPRHCVALPQWNLWNERTKQLVLKVRRSSLSSGRVRCRPKSKHETCTVIIRPSRHYREIGIRAVAAATRKESTASPRTRDSMAINRKSNSTHGGHN